MSENPTPEPAQDPKGEQPDPEPKGDETDWKAEARKWEQRAKENKTAAEKLAEIEESKKTEIEKAAERAKAAEERATKAEGELMRLFVAHNKGLTPGQAKRLVGSTKEELEADADEILAEFGPKKVAAPPAKKLHSGSAGADGATTGRERAAAALRQLRGN